jgi:hypothetical protein
MKKKQDEHRENTIQNCIWEECATEDAHPLQQTILGCSISSAVSGTSHAGGERGIGLDRVFFQIQLVSTTSPVFIFSLKYACHIV